MADSSDVGAPFERTAGGKLASRTIPIGAAGNGVKGSIYDGDKTVAVTSTREAIASGVESVYVYNQGATNFMRFRFGDSTVDATVSTGFFLAAGDSISAPVPSGATHWAYIADTLAVTSSVVWGG